MSDIKYKIRVRISSERNKANMKKYYADSAYCLIILLNTNFYIILLASLFYFNLEKNMAILHAGTLSIIVAP